MAGRIISCAADLAEGAAWLGRVEPRFADALGQTGTLHLRRREGGFGALLQTIIAQQVSVASAEAMMLRLTAAGLTGREAIAAASEKELRASGLSRQKVRYVQTLAASTLDFEALSELPDAEVIARLTALTGIGRWTAEIYVMFSLGRADVFAAGDLALQEAARLVLGLDHRPSERELRNLAETWSPWRSVACCLLWQYYKVIKQRDGVRV